MPTAILAAPTPPSATLPPHVLGYRALKLWQRALDLAADAYRLVRGFSEADQAAVGADLRRAAAAVPSGVAVSAQAIDRWERQRALQLTAAALARAETLAALAERTGALASADATAFLFAAGDVARLLRGFVRSTAARMVEPGTAVQAVVATEGASAMPPAPVVARVAEPPVEAVVAPQVELPAESEQVTPPASEAAPLPPSMRTPARARRGGRRQPVGDGAAR